jgi:uncharacterized membrane protein YfcA
VAADAELLLVLAVLGLGAAVVNGALGHGFSSMTVPVALLFTTGRTLNPALVLVELVLNGHVLLASRAALPAVRRRVLPLVIGLVPGVGLGAGFLRTADPAWVKLAAFGALLPLVLLQAAGFRRPVRAERAAAATLGLGVGALYAVTTVSGPPLALAFNNQGLVQREFRAALALVRMAEGVLTAAAYLALGLYAASTPRLVLAMLPGVVLGVPLGAALARRLEPEAFRRLCMSFDAWIVGFGLSRLLADLGLLEPLGAHALLAAVILLDAALLYRFYRGRRGTRCRAPLGLERAA